ncbi:MAG: DUF4411 family protein [Candidatus Daviesbacteria bacterium]|nr:DUF4411 family protein [Candidatus Daviesbacteria bacterium]
MYLPDTNIFILAFSDFEPTNSFLQKIIKQGKIYISVVVMAEFLAKASEEEARFFEQLVSQFGVLEVDEEVARISAEYRKQLSQKSKRNILIDCFLAAQAKIHGLTLVTNNKADFPMKDIKIISP